MTSLLTKPLESLDVIHQTSGLTYLHAEYDTWPSLGDSAVAVFDTPATRCYNLTIAGSPSKIPWRFADVSHDRNSGAALVLHFEPNPSSTIPYCWHRLTPGIGSERNAHWRLRSLNSGWSKSLDRIVVDLGRLKDGWEGPGAMAPSPKLIRDLERALSVLPAATQEPEVEVDSSDGSVSLRWETDTMDRAVTFVFRGSGKVVIINLALGVSPGAPCITDVDDETRILDALDVSGGNTVLTA